MSGGRKIGKVYPHLWITGPDPFIHSMHMPYLRSKAQANFRGEGWDMSFEEFVQLWKDQWENRGRQADNMCMTRKDSSKKWSFKNCEVITRHQHLINQGFNRSHPTEKRK